MYRGTNYHPSISAIREPTTGASGVKDFLMARGKSTTPLEDTFKAILIMERPLASILSSSSLMALSIEEK